jgi:hypothetical protein
MQLSLFWQTARAWKMPSSRVYLGVEHCNHKDAQAIFGNRQKMSNKECHPTSKETAPNPTNAV